MEIRPKSPLSCPVFAMPDRRKLFAFASKDTFLDPPKAHNESFSGAYSKSPFVRLLGKWIFVFPIDQGTSSQSGTTTSKPAQHKSSRDNPNCTDKGTYRNRDGQPVPRPENCSSAPSDATAQCRDGTYSFSMHRSGTCSHHGGVARWL
jgi:hypothetical protein